MADTDRKPLTISKKVIENMREAIPGATEEDIKAMLTQCNGDVNQATERLLEEPFHQVVSKKEAKKAKTTEERKAPAPGGHGHRGDYSNGGPYRGGGGGRGRGSEGRGGGRSGSFGGRGGGYGGRGYSAPPRPAADTGYHDSGRDVAADASFQDFSNATGGAAWDTAVDSSAGAWEPQATTTTTKDSAWGSAATTGTPAPSAPKPQAREEAVHG